MPTWSRAGSASWIDKGARFTDWSRRPLTERQIEYAIGDVTYLATIFPKILKTPDQDRARRMARRRDGKARRSGELPQRSRHSLAPASARRPQSRWCSAACKATRRLARGRGAGQEHPARPDHARRDARRSRQPSAQGRRPTSPKSADCRQAWRENEIGKAADARDRGTRSRCRADEMPEKPKRGAPLGKEGALVADLLKLLLKIRSREIDVAVALLTRRDEMEARSPPACASCRCSKAGGARCSARTRSTWSRASSRFAVEKGASR